MKKVIKAFIPPIIIYALNRLNKKNRNRRNLPDKNLYRPLFSPWCSTTFSEMYLMLQPHTLVDAKRAWVLYTLAQQALHLPGDFWEMGVYRGGTALLLNHVLTAKNPDKTLHLFDTFCGMPATKAEFDYHKQGDFADTQLENVKKLFNGSQQVQFHAGYIPETFAGLEHHKISLAHIDVDIHQSVLDCCNFIYPRLTTGGFMIFDDYGFPSCPGARKAVDDYFKDKVERPLILENGQAIIIKTTC
ncbi:MAG: hypothetical protein Tsb005_05010 [Gammaproteobacteria bacterium]